MNICLFGASSEGLDKEYYEEARKFGMLIAKGGHCLIYGGSERGIMKACAEGVIENGGKLIGVAPRFFIDSGVLSQKCSQVIYTETMSERKQTMEDISDAFAVFPGGIGTFDEFFETMTLRQLNVHCKAIAVVNTLGYFDEMVDMLQASARKGFMSDGCLRLFKLCASPEEAIEYINQDPSLLTKGRGLASNK